MVSFGKDHKTTYKKKLGVHVALNSNLSKENGINIYTDYGKES